MFELLMIANMTIMVTISAIYSIKLTPLLKVIKPAESSIQTEVVYTALAGCVMKSSVAALRGPLRLLCHIG